MADARARTGKPRPPLTDRERIVLEFAAEHRLLVREHVQALVGIEAAAAARLLRGLADAGLLRREQPFHRGPGWWRITRAGVRAVSSPLGPPRADLGAWRHDLGLAWLHLAARSGTFGALREVVSERRMRSHDAVGVAASTEQFGVRLGGYGPGGRERLHYPDLLFVDNDGRRIAVELELSRKAGARRDAIFFGYACARQRIDAVLYLVESRSMAQSIRATAARFGISDRVHVQYVRTGDGPGPRGGGRSPAARVRPGAGRGSAEARR
jgi:hypothetical protein